jgi:hypothetical protein
MSEELDYSFLKEQGIAYIHQLAGNKWTDYGIHDPGITILEELCFGILDLVYRTSFSIEDVWAKDPNETIPSNDNPFYRAEEILPCNPLTQWDFLKIVLDVPGVKNANLSLSRGPNEIKGGYKVFIELEERIRNSKQQSEETLAIVKQRLHTQRNLCEDFFVIQPMQSLPICIKANFETQRCLAYEEGETIAAKILFDLHEFLSPRIPFYNISQLLEKGRTIDQIFTGPLLTQGFIDEPELIQQKKRSKTMYISDLIEHATTVENVKNVLCFELFVGDPTTPLTNVTLPIAHDQFPELNTQESKITLSHNGTAIPIDWEKVLHLLEDMKGRGTLSKTYLQKEEVFVLEGDYRDLKKYISLQQDLPLLYNVGHEGCTPSEKAKNHAKAKQLQAYLLIFDQIFATYLGRLSNIRHRMAAYSPIWDKPDALVPLQVPRMETIIKEPTPEDHTANDWAFVIQRKYIDTKEKIQSNPDKTLQNKSIESYNSYVNQILETEFQTLIKRSNMLDHLLAYFAEKYTTYSGLLDSKSKEDQIKSINILKSLFLKDYIEISKNRNRGANHTPQPIDVWTDYTPSGFERRICYNLGIQNTQKRCLHEIIRSNFFLDKKSTQNNFDLFLGKNTQSEYNHLFMFKGKYKNIQSLALAYGINEAYYHISKTHAGHYMVLLYIDQAKQHWIEFVPNNNLTTIEQAEEVVQQSVAFFKMCNKQSEGFHLIEHILLRDQDTITTEDDPYSFIMTMVFPAWPARFQRASFRKLVEEMALLESPAHICTNVLWLDFEDMTHFEVAYKTWMTLKAEAASKAEIEQAAQTLMQLIQSHSNRAVA